MSQIRKQYRIIIEDPPAGRQGGPGNGPLQTFLKRLFAEHPGEWAVLDRHRKHIGYLYNLKKRFPNLEVATRKNADDTFGVWVKMNPVTAEDKVPASAELS